MDKLIIDLTTDQSRIREEKGQYIHLIPMKEQPNTTELHKLDSGVWVYYIAEDMLKHINPPYKIKDKVIVKTEKLRLFPEDTLWPKEKVELVDTIISIEPGKVKDLDWKDRNNNEVPLYKMSEKEFRQMREEQKEFVKDFNNRFGAGQYDKNIWTWQIWLKK